MINPTCPPHDIWILYCHVPIILHPRYPSNDWTILKSCSFHLKRPRITVKHLHFHSFSHILTLIIKIPEIPPKKQWFSHDVPLKSSWTDDFPWIFPLISHRTSIFPMKKTKPRSGHRGTATEMVWSLGCGDTWEKSLGAHGSSWDLNL